MAVGAVVCVTLLDRLVQDQVSEPKSTLKSWEERPATIVARYIRRCLDATANGAHSNGFDAHHSNNNCVTFSCK